jgi:phosphotransferase family enzyme
MAAIPVKLPDSAALERALCACFSDLEPDTLRVLDRQASGWNSWFPAELVTCQIGRAGILKLWCKYADSRPRRGIEGDRSLEYEATLYREVLSGSPAPTAHCHGFYRHPSEGWACLVLEYLKDCLPFSKTSALAEGGSWLGAFHAWTETRTLPGWVRTLEAEGYEEQVFRRQRLFEPWHDRYPALAHLSQRTAEVVTTLLSSPRVLVHGEFFPLNVLVRSGTFIPVDWETAAIGAGEIDLAAMTEGWSRSLQEAGEAAYIRARWGGIAPSQFRRRLQAARIYWSIDSLAWLIEHRRRAAESKLQRKIARHTEELLTHFTEWASD